MLVASTLEARQSGSSRALLTEPINEQQLVRLAGNMRPEANAANDRGQVADDMAMAHLNLLLKRPVEQQAALDQYTAELQNPNSPNFHHWLTAQTLGSRFGLAGTDIATITAWLTGHGFQVNTVLPSGNLIEFSGTAGQVREAFHTEIHRLTVNGETHLANMSDPQIPAALAAAVAGITSLNDFQPHPVSKAMEPAPADTAGNARYVGPADLATIYNLNALYAAGISGQGQTIAVLESSDMYSTADWYAYRRVFGLTKAYPLGTLTQMQPASDGVPCGDPGATTASDREATLDAEMVTAAAPNANVILAACAQNYDPGIFIALRNLLNSPNPPGIMSLSYGQSEAVTGETENAFIYALYEQAAAEGVSVFVCTGDWGADSYYTDRGTPSIHGLSVNGLASTPFNVAVGGTDFEDTYLHETSLYWNSTNTAALGSAKSYVPEIAWDGSCADPFWAEYYGFSTSYGSSGYCNSPSVAANNLTGLVGSGGPSSCAYGIPSTPGYVGGTCRGYAKPAWQSVVGNPNDGVRDLPDVAMFASGGAWGHAYYICYSDPSNSGTACSDAFQVSGGTSAATPVMASIQALVNQNTGQTWGNPNPIYYALANSEYGATGNDSCNASLGNAIGAGCIFHDITAGTNEVICQPGTPNCFAPSGALGVISLSTTAYIPAYAANEGWDFTTGIGSVNAYNLVENWSKGVLAAGQQ